MTKFLKKKLKLKIGCKWPVSKKKKNCLSFACSELWYFLATLWGSDVDNM